MIGKIERVPLREVWKNEAKDFTTWLFENLEVLGEELDMDLTPDENHDSEFRIIKIDITSIIVAATNNPYIVIILLQKVEAQS